MANNNQIYKMSNAGGVKSLVRYSDMLAGNAVWNPWSPVGAYDSIATVTVGSGGAASITFTSIPSTYKHLQIRVLAQTNRATYGVDDIYLRMNGDSGNNYAWHQLVGDGTSAASQGATSYSAMDVSSIGTTAGGTFGAAVIDILDYASTSKNKTLRALAGVDLNGTVAGYGGQVQLDSSLWMNTAAVTSITITPRTGTSINQYSSFALFGVK